MNTTQPSQQQIIKLNFKSIKNLREFDIDFSGNNLTDILGTNGCGKSTIIHALACCYQPIDEKESINYKFSYFFLPTTHSLWKGSELTLTHSYRTGQKQHSNMTVYDKLGNRWKPIYKRRPERYVSFIGIKTCVPKIEDESKKSLIEYTTQPLSDELSLDVKKYASQITSRDYTTYNIHSFSSKEYIGVEYKGQSYSALSMGAGEQRLFFMLKEVFKAPKYSLILIDEIDLLLHEDALDKLINILIDRAESKSLQIIFTTHAQSIIKFEAKINIRHIYQANDRTLCFNETRPDAMYRLTGKQDRPLEIFVEDDLAKAVVKKVSGELGLSKYVSIKEYGAAGNCFTVLSGLLLNKDPNIDNMLFILDGDVYETPEKKNGQIERVLTGTSVSVDAMRKKAIKYISQLLPDDLRPELFLHKLIKELPEQSNEEHNEVIRAAKDITVADGSHKYINDLITRMDFERSAGLKTITDLASLSPNWQNYTEEVRNWLISKKDSVMEKN